jgi:hypothetical protein
MATLILDKASKLDIQYRQRDSFAFEILAKNDGVNIDFSGYTAKLEIRDALSLEVLKTLTESSGITLTTGNIAIDGGLLNLGKQELIYDLQLTSGGGVVSTFLHGRLVEVKDVTA